MRRIRSFLQAVRSLPGAIAADRRGASVVEFALFAPILGLGVMGISDVSMGYARKLELEQAAYRALEKVAVGTTQTDYSTLRAEAAAGAGVPTSAVTVDTWLECDRVRQTSFTGVCTGTQEISRYVSVQIQSSYRPSFNYGPLAARYANANGVVPITAVAAVRIQ